MTVTAVVGAHWGDEGKGKIVDYFAEKYDIVARWNGGDNAGHTVITEDGKKLAFHNIPSGMRHKKVTNVIGNGEVVNLESLLNEIEDLERNGVEVTPDRLVLSDSAHLILPHYFEIERRKETARGVGTTGRAIGPTYTFKPDRSGIRVLDLLDSGRNFLQNVRTHAEEYGIRVNPKGLLESQRQLLERLVKYLAVDDTAAFFRKNKGANILLEGAQGVLLDIDSGTYPYVTSSHTIPGGAYIGCVGIPSIDRVVLVMKAGYVTRVGHGPFPTEMGSEEDIEQVQKDSEGLADKDIKSAKEGDPVSLAKYHRVKGGEYGTTTGRPRRVGHQDLVAARYASNVSDIGNWQIGSLSIVLTKLDITDGLPEIKVCIGYNRNGTGLSGFPRDVSLDDVEPYYERLGGWGDSTRGLTGYSSLPANAQRLVSFLEHYLNTPVSLISTGQKRQEIINRGENDYY